VKDILKIGPNEIRSVGIAMLEANIGSPKPWDDAVLLASALRRLGWVLPEPPSDEPPEA
jgi:hypothetical protein